MSSPTGGLVGAAGTDTNVPTNPDGTPDLSSIILGTDSTSTPVDGIGAVNAFSLPNWIVQWEKQVPKPIYFGNNPQGGNGSQTDVSPTFNQAGAAGNALRAANGLKESIEKPQSFDTDMSAEDVMKQFAAMDPTELMSMQQLLATGPWNMSSTYTPSGVFDSQTKNALIDAISNYLLVSREGGKAISFTDYLMTGAQQGAANKQATLAAKQPAVSLTDPAQLKMSVQGAAQAALGHGLTDGQLNTFVDNFHSMEETAANTAYSKSGGDGATYTHPDQPAQALQFAENSNPQEFADHNAQGYMDTFMNMFLSGNSSRGNVQPVARI